MRREAAKSLGILHSEKAIPILFHNYTPSQNLERAAQEIQQLIQQLKQDNPQVTEKELKEKVSR